MYNYAKIIENCINKVKNVSKHFVAAVMVLYMLITAHISQGDLNRQLHMFNHQKTLAPASQPYNQQFIYSKLSLRNKTGFAETK